MTLRAAVVLGDYSVKPVPLMPVVARRDGSTDSLAGRTNLDGRLVMTLPVGSYTLRAASPSMGGRSFTWEVPVVVRQAATQRIELTNANASPDAASGLAGGAAVAARAADASALVAPPSPPIANRREVKLTHYRANTSGLLLGVGLNGSLLHSEDLEISAESGSGLSAQLGWGFTRSFALFLDASAARMTAPRGDYNLGHIDAGVRWHFVTRSRALVPFLEGALSGRAADKTYQGSLSVAGVGFSLGGGLQYHIAPTVAVGGTLKWTTGEFSRVLIDTVSVDGFEIDATSARFNLGLTWHPMRRR